MVARRLLPLPSSDVLHHPDRPIASTRPRSPSAHTCRFGRWHHNLRATRTRGIVEGDRVVGGVRRDARHVAVDRRDQIDARRRVIERRLGQDFGDDHTRSVDRNMELLPATRAASAVFRGGPFAFADYRESRAVDDEVHGFAPWDSTKGELEVLAAPRERRMIGRGQIEAHQPEERRQDPLGLAEGQGEDEPDRQRRFNREVGVPQLPAPPADPRGLPGGDGGRREPDRDVASSDEGAIVGGPVLDAVFRLVRGMDSRLHPPQSSRRLGFCETSRQCWSLEPAGARIHAPTPPTGGRYGER